MDYFAGLDISMDGQEINDAQSASRSGSPPRDHHARDAAGRNRIRIGISPRNLRDRRPNPAPMTPEGGSRRRRGFCCTGPTAGRLRFQPSRPAPSLPHQAPNERERTQASQGVDSEEQPLALDPLKNDIRRLRPAECANSGRSPKGANGSMRPRAAIRHFACGLHTLGHLSRKGPAADPAPFVLFPRSEERSQWQKRGRSRRSWSRISSAPVHSR